MRRRYSGWNGRLAHPRSPAGSGGPGGFSQAGPLGHTVETSALHHPDSPAARLTDAGNLARFDVLDRAEYVYVAIQRAKAYAPAALAKETGRTIHELVSGLLPMLILSVGVLGATSAIGAAAGAAVGALAAGAGALPGAVIGAGVGFDAGLWLLNIVGLGFLLIYVKDGLQEVVALASSAMAKAWHAADRGDPQQAIDDAAKDLAKAVGVFFRLVLQGLVAFLLVKGSQAAATRLAELVGKLRETPLGTRFAVWVEANWQSLVEDPHLRPQPAWSRATTPAESGGAPAGTPRAAAPAVREPARPAAKRSERPPAKAPKYLTEEELASWYRNQGDYFKNPKNLENHLEGTDFTKPVVLRELPKGTEVIQYVRADGKPGMYFAEPGTPMSRLGIFEPPPRVVQRFVVDKPIEVVESTAATIPELAPGVGGQGGGQQLIFPKGWESSVVPMTGGR